MLADRSFRTMAATTTLFAFIMVVICLVHSSEFAHRANRSSTSVGGKSYVYPAMIHKISASLLPK